MNPSQSNLRQSSKAGFSAAWEDVECSCCGKRYRCTPQNDYYNATSLTDGVCETCLLLNADIHPDNIVTGDVRA